MKKIKYLLTSLLLIALTSCYISNSNSSSQSSSTSNNSLVSSNTNSNISTSSSLSSSNNLSSGSNSISSYNSSSSSSSSSSSTTSSSTNSSISSNSNSSTDKVYGSVPDGVKVYKELEAIEYMKSSNYEQFEEMYVSGIIASSSYNNSNGKYRITFKNDFQIYLGYTANGIPSLKNGDEIVVFGKSMIYQNYTYELAYDKSHGSYPEIIKLTRKEIIYDTDDPNFNSYGFPIIEVDIDDYNVTKNGIYNTKEEVSIYIYLYGYLPSNYRTKSQFNKSDYTKENKLSTGGDRFYNKEGILPDIPNIRYIEADIDYTGGSRNAKRIVYSDDPLLIFYTSDHYASFSIMKVVE